MGKRVAILGSTGSIGRQTLEVVARQGDLHACGLAAGTNWRLLAEQARRYRPDVVAIADAAAGDALSRELPDGVELLRGPDAMTQMVRRTRPDVLLSGVVGSAGVMPTLAGIECGATIAIANKETLVVAGAVVMPAARKAGVPVLPVDSEHSAIFQCLLAGRSDEVRRIVLTASGGALRDRDPAEIEHASVEDALNHPTWRMGRKITIDSATLMNKALEVVEAHWLFDLPAEQIQVVLHPESIIHSMVEFRDGAVIAQLSQPDMTMPIAYALNWPARADRGGAALDLAALGKLTFRTPTGRFARAVALGHEAIRRGPAAGAALIGANDSAVEAFLAGRCRFGQIVPIVEDVMNHTAPMDEVTLDSLRSVEAAARAEVQARLAGKTA